MIVPTYHAERYLAECLDSLLGQTLRPHEVIVCDDGSRDRTPELIHQYADLHPDIIKPLLHSANQGISRNFNSGLRAATGNMISLCAGDDWWAANKLEQEIETLGRVPGAKWAYSDSVAYIQRTGEFKSFRRRHDGASGQILLQVLTRQMSLRNWLAQSTLIRQVGSFDESLSCFEDWDYKIRLAARSPVAYCSNAGVFYRRHRGGVSRNPRQNAASLEQVQKKHERLLKRFSDRDSAEIQRIWKKDLVNHRRRWSLRRWAGWVARKVMPDQVAK